MDWNFMFFANSVMLGVGLAMDAFSVSIVNGLNEPKMSVGRRLGISGTYAWFQFMMPMIGWICVHTVVEKFTAFEPAIPWIALILLIYIGGKMLLEGLGVIGGESGENSQETGDGNAPADRITENTGAVRFDEDGCPIINESRLTFTTLIIQGIATSIDALSVGFTIATYGTLMALVCSVIIALVTWAICLVGLKIGIKVGSRFSDHATVFGGIVLIFIGLEIFVRGVFLA